MSFNLRVSPSFNARYDQFVVEDHESPLWQAGYRTGRRGKTPNPMCLEYPLFQRGYEAGAERRLFVRLFVFFVVTLAIAFFVDATNFL